MHSAPAWPAVQVQVAIEAALVLLPCLAAPDLCRFLRVTLHRVMMCEVQELLHCCNVKQEHATSGVVYVITCCSLHLLKTNGQDELSERRSEPRPGIIWQGTPSTENVHRHCQPSILNTQLLYKESQIANGAVCWQVLKPPTRPSLIFFREPGHCVYQSLAALLCHRKYVITPY